MSKAIEDVLDERKRQVEAEGWGSEHDDSHTYGKLAMAGACYAFHAAKHPNANRTGISPPAWWPWSPVWWKPKSPRRDLVRAAALLIAEIERLDRRERALKANDVQ